MRFAYADPPYPTLSRRYYGDHRDFDGEVDHAKLVERLVAEYPDGWALSTSAAATRDVWALCPKATRLHVWVNGPRKVKSFQALHAYESLFVFGGRPRREAVVEDLSDVLQWGGRQHSHPGALPGMKPAPFCEWVFQLLGATHGDQLDDLFPGSGAVSRAWSLYTSPAGGDDASARSGRDASTPAPRDVARDVSPGSGGDATLQGPRDGSQLEAVDASRVTTVDGDS